MAAQKKDWVLTRESFEGLLVGLDKDRERAAKKYEETRQRLLKFFEWSGCTLPEDYADETLNRAARRIQEGERIENFNSYCYGIARMLLKESFRKKQREQEVLDQLSSSMENTPDSGETEARSRCLEECMQKLAPESHRVFSAYYQAEGVKKAERSNLAERLGIPMNALRIRIHRIRAGLEECVRGCFERWAADLK